MAQMQSHISQTAVVSSIPGKVKILSGAYVVRQNLSRDFLLQNIPELSPKSLQMHLNLAAPLVCFSVLYPVSPKLSSEEAPAFC